MARSRRTRRRWTWAGGRGRGQTEQLVGTDAQDLGEPDDELTVQAQLAPFVVGDDGLGDAQSPGQLGLGQPALTPQPGQPLADGLRGGRRRRCGGSLGPRHATVLLDGDDGRQCTGHFARGRRGHWVSPIEFAGGDLNLYAYVGNNPTTFTDPFGLDRDCCPDGHPRDALNCYSRCVNTLVINPAGYLANLLVFGSASSIGGSRLPSGERVLVAAGRSIGRAFGSPLGGAVEGLRLLNQAYVPQIASRFSVNLSATPRRRVRERREGQGPVSAGR